MDRFIRVLTESIGLLQYGDLPDARPYGFFVYPDGSIDIVKGDTHSRVLNLAIKRYEEKHGKEPNLSKWAAIVRETMGSPLLYVRMNRSLATNAQRRTIEDMAKLYQTELSWVSY